MTEKPIKRMIPIVAVLILCIAIFMQIYANLFHYAARMDADVAGEAILAKEIAENNLKIPDTWYISTETRYIYPANLGAVIYFFLHDIQLSMGISCSICIVVLIIIMFALYRKIGMGKLASLSASIIPFIITLNVHDALEMFSLYAGYYFSVLFVFYLTGIIFVDLLKGRKNLPGLVIAVICSLLLGAQGMRGTLMVYIPYICALFVLCFLKGFLAVKNEVKNKLFLMILCIALAGSSFLTCKILSSGISDTSRNIRNGFNKLLLEVIPSIMKLFDCNENKLYLIFVTILTTASLLSSLYYIFVKKLNDEKKFMLLALWMAFLVMVMAMAFTTFEVTPRYSVFLLFLIGMGVGIFLDETINVSKKGTVFYIFMVQIIICSIFSGVYNYNNLIATDKSQNSVYNKVALWMEENNVEKGYATFDYASVITVVSNGISEVYPVNSMSELYALKWLSNANWYPPYTDEKEHVAIITTDATDEDFESFYNDNSHIEILQTTDIGKFHCYILSENPVRLDNVR